MVLQPTRAILGCTLLKLTGTFLTSSERTAQMAHAWLDKYRIYIVAVKFGSVYDSRHPLWLTRRLPGSDGARIPKKSVPMRENGGCNLFLGLALSLPGLCYVPLRFASSLTSRFARAHAIWSLPVMAASSWRLVLAELRYA